MSWVNAAAVVLDAAALRVSTVDAPVQAGARLVVRAGARSLWGIAAHLGRDAGPPPAASSAGDDPNTGTDARRIRLTREQFDAARAGFTGWPAAHVAEQPGISRATAYRWVRRYRAEGEAGLLDRSTRPHCPPRRLPAPGAGRPPPGVVSSRRWGASSPRA